MPLSLAEVARNRFRARINEILQQLASQSLDSDSQESVSFIVLKLCITQSNCPLSPADASPKK